MTFLSLLGEELAHGEKFPFPSPPVFGIFLVRFIALQIKDSTYFVDR